MSVGFVDLEIQLKSFERSDRRGRHKGPRPAAHRLLRKHIARRGTRVLVQGMMAPQLLAIEHGIPQ